MLSKLRQNGDNTQRVELKPCSHQYLLAAISVTTFDHTGRFTVCQAKITIHAFALATRLYVLLMSGLFPCLASRIAVTWFYPPYAVISPQALDRTGDNRKPQLLVKAAPTHDFHPLCAHLFQALSRLPRPALL